MPMNREHLEAGLLLREGATLILRRDDGGRWRLEAGREAERWLGRRVRVRSTRCGFDAIAVAGTDLAD
jgi:hypothetical protein